MVVLVNPEPMESTDRGDRLVEEETISPQDGEPVEDCARSLVASAISDTPEAKEEATEFTPRHLINTVFNEESDEEGDGSISSITRNDQPSSDQADVEVNFTKVECTKIRGRWDKEDDVCTQRYRETERPIVIMWHNVNGIKSFLKHLRQEGASYFKPKELSPDIFGILEAKVSQANEETTGLITEL